MIYGIDVSRFNPENFSTKGLDFTFIKATEGHTIINPHQNKQAYTSRHAGLVTGFYHFLRDGNFTEQAHYFVEKCASVPGDPLVVDWEDTSVSCAEKDKFLKAVKALRPTHKVGLYCNVDFWLHRDTTSYCGDFLWIADYSSKPGHPRIQHAWAFHQFSEKNGVDSDAGNFSSRSALSKWTRSV